MNNEASQLDVEHAPTGSPRRTPVSFDEGVTLIRDLEPIAVQHGFHLGMTGGVLYRGSSEKDLDVIVYQHDYRSPVASKANFLQALAGLGAEDIFQTDREYLDKDVVLVTLHGKRIDFFFLYGR